MIKKNNAKIKNVEFYVLQVVHNYGHGSEGLSLFWGCALEARDLILSFLNRNCP